MQWDDRLMSMNDMVRVLDRTDCAQWLTRGEREWLRSFGAPQRVRQWLGGRWLAKQILITRLASMSFRPCDIHVESRDGRDRAVRPQVFLRGRLQPWTVSISHSDHAIYVAATTRADAKLGVDVVPLQRLSKRFVDYWFTDYERQWCLRSADPCAACLLWSLKEAYYKANNDGQPFAPRRIDVVTETPLADLDGHIVGGSLAGNRFVFEDKRCTFVIRRTDREVATLVWIPGTARSTLGRARRTDHRTGHVTIG